MSGAVLAGLFLGIYLIWRTVAVLLRFNAWLIPVVLLHDCALGLACIVTGYQGDHQLGPVLWGFALAFVMWKIWFFYALFRWEPVRGLYRLSRWPRRPLMKGPGKRQRREFREPMPWTRGPASY